MRSNKSAETLRLALLPLAWTARKASKLWHKFVVPHCTLRLGTNILAWSVVISIIADFAGKYQPVLKALADLLATIALLVLVYIPKQTTTK